MLREERKVYEVEGEGESLRDEDRAQTQDLHEGAQRKQGIDTSLRRAIEGRVGANT